MRRYADLVFSATIDGRESLIFFLIEHQSEPDELIVFRMLRYVVRLWDQVLRQEPDRKRLPAVLPVLLLHTRSASTNERPLVFRDLLDVDPELLPLLLPHVPDFELLVEDVDRLPLDVLRNRSLPAQVELMLFLLKRARMSPSLLQERRFPAEPA